VKKKKMFLYKKIYYKNVPQHIMYKAQIQIEELRI